MRVKIQFPEKLLFRTTIPVRITDVNYGNHTGNDSLVSILHEARMQWLQSLGMSELKAGGTSLIMADIAIRFHHESYYGDKLLIEIYVGDQTPKSFDLYYKVMRDDENKTMIASAKTGMVCFDYDLGSIVPKGEELKKILT
jgi:acyl-CoA thioesterase FadM